MELKIDKDLLEKMEQAISKIGKSAKDIYDLNEAQVKIDAAFDKFYAVMCLLLSGTSFMLCYFSFVKKWLYNASGITFPGGCIHAITFILGIIFVVSGFEAFKLYIDGTKNGKLIAVKKTFDMIHRNILRC